jgi:hypothetical protein
VGLCIPSSLLGNVLVNTIPRKRKIVGGVVFYIFHTVSKKSRRLVLPTTSCLIALFAPLRVYCAGYVPNIILFVHLKIFMSQSAFNLCERLPGTHWAGGWMDPRILLVSALKIEEL